MRIRSVVWCVNHKVPPKDCGCEINTSLPFGCLQCDGGSGVIEISKGLFFCWNCVRSKRAFEPRKEL